MTANREPDLRNRFIVRVDIEKLFLAYDYFQFIFDSLNFELNRNNILLMQQTPNPLAHEPSVVPPKTKNNALKKILMIFSQSLHGFLGPQIQVTFCITF